MKRFIAFSGGVESTTMCVLWGGQAKAIFADTGWEHQVMYDRIDFVEQEIKKIHPGFEVIRIKKDDGLLDYIKKSGFFPSPMARFCTRMFKIEPIDNFLKNQGECELYIGLNAEEIDRVGNHGLAKNVKYKYPLIENGINRDACHEILKKANLDTDKLPAYMTRGGCVGCFFKRKYEFEAMYHLSRDEFESLETLENELQDVRKKFYAIESNGNTLKSIREKAQSSLFKADEMYSDTLHTPCGVFCHR